MKRLYQQGLLVLLLLCTTTTGIAQFLNEWTYDSIKSYYRNLIINSTDTAFDGEITKYNRFTALNDYKYNRGGKISEYVNLIREFNATSLSRSASTNASGLNADWRCLGPLQAAESALGRVTAIWVSPTAPHYILAGTRSSGIWKSNGDLQNPVWTCLTDFKMKACGISDIAVSPINPNVIYASTNFSGSYTTWYGAGLVYSTDGGESWTEDLNIPPSFYTNSGWQRRFEMPLRFKPGTGELFIARDTKVFKKNTANGTWTVNSLLDIGLQTDDAFFLNQIHFSPLNYDVVVVTGTFESEKETRYSIDGGSTWQQLNFGPNSSQFFGEASPIKSKSYKTAAGFDQFGSLYVLMEVKNELEVGSSPFRTYIFRFVQDESQQFVLDKKWDFDPYLNSFAVRKGGLTDLIVIRHTGNNTTNIFFGGGQNYPQRTVSFSDFSTSVRISELSNGSSGESSTIHIDTRDIYYLPNLGLEGALFVATDGGVSMSSNMFGFPVLWQNINGTGFAMSEFIGFGHSEFDKNYIVTAGIDGNSWKFQKSGIVRAGGNDAYEVSVARLQDHKEKWIMSSNGSGPGFPIGFLGDNDQISIPYSDPSKRNTMDDEYIYSLAQFDFESESNFFYMGSTDVYRMETMYNSVDPTRVWKLVSYTHKGHQFKSIMYPTTNRPVSAFKTCKKPDNPTVQVAVYAVQGWRNPGAPYDIKLIKVEYDDSKDEPDERRKHFDISPYTVDGNTAESNSLYKSWILDIVLDENNPDRMWVCFGGSSSGVANQMDVKGRIYQRDLNAAGTAYEWKDVSAGLPPFPILSMVYWKGTNDIIFAGTDVGVYVFNKAAGVWEPFMQNLPYVTVPELEINYCSNTLRACTSGRGIWETPLPSLPEGQEIPIEVSSNQVWNSSRDTYQGVLVKAGATLTISGIHNASNNTNSVEIRIPKDKEIRVEPGAKLIISGATITNHCDLWQGIEVEGARDQMQNGSTQGWVVIKDGAIIENARTAISTSKVYDWGWDIESTGGIVHCYNSTFRNNRRDVELLKYSQTSTKKTEERPNRAVFKQCKFITDNDFLFGEQKPVHITMWEVNGASIIGCSFEDARETPQGAIGIYTIGSGFNVNEYCASSNTVPVSSSPACAGIQTKFKNLEYGVYAMSNSNPKYSVNVSNTLFENCSRAVYLNGISNASITLNSMLVKRATNSPLNGYTTFRYGLYLDQCKGYKVEENSFEGDVNVEQTTNSFGIVVRNMHGDNTILYKNTFNLLTAGIEAIARNKSNTLDKGLQITCNNFNASKYDILVLNDPEIPSPVDLCGIARVQGYPNPAEPNRLAGNLFGNSSPYLISNFVNQGGYLQYFYHDPATQSRVLPTNYQTPAKIGLFNTNVPFNNAIACPSSFTNIFTAEQLRSSVITGQEALEANQAALASMVDAGNTELFLAELDFTDPVQVNTNYFLLMSVSPYLSRTVLIRVAEDGSAFSNAMIRNILVACAQGAKDAEVQARLDNRTNPLPTYMRTQIDAGLVEMSAMEIEERQIGTYQQLIDHSVTETMWRATQDTLNLASNVFDIFAEVNDPAQKLQLIEWLDADEQANQANAILSDIENNIEAEDYSNFQTLGHLRQFRINLQNQNISAHQLDASQIQELNDYLGLPEAGTSYAMALLKLNNQLNYIEPVLLPQGGGASRSLNAPTTTNVLELDPSESSLELSPNPANSLFVARYKVLEPSKNLQLIVTDLLGKEVYAQKLNNQIDEVIIPCGNLQPGTYVVGIIGEGIQALDQKLVIQK